MMGHSNTSLKRNQGRSWEEGCRYLRKEHKRTFKPLYYLSTRSNAWSKCSLRYRILILSVNKFEENILLFSQEEPNSLCSPDRRVILIELVRGKENPVLKPAVIDT